MSMQESSRGLTTIASTINSMQHAGYAGCRRWLAPKTNAYLSLSLNVHNFHYIYCSRKGISLLTMSRVEGSISSHFQLNTQHSTHRPPWWSPSSHRLSSDIFIWAIRNNGSNNTKWPPKLGSSSQEPASCSFISQQDFQSIQRQNTNETYRRDEIHVQ